MTLFEDNAGATSSMRVVMIVWFLGILGASLWQMISSGAWPALPPEYIAVLMSLLTGKVWQSHIETKATDTDTK